MPPRRAVQRYIEDPLAEELLLGTFGEGDIVMAEISPEDPLTVVFKKKEVKASKKKKELVTN